MSKHNDNHQTHPVEEKQTVVEETVVPDYPVVEELKALAGVVTNCRKLNVREHPDTSADVLGELLMNSEVRVVANEKYDEWYHVITASGIDGYCMKKYIEVH